jgi:DNA-binding CsgD family transcriptional regulator
MLKEVRPKIPDLSEIECADSLLAPMLKAAGEGKRLEPALLEIIRTLGFESFIFAIATEPRPNRDSRVYIWTSLPRPWVEAYERNAYIEIDPRISASYGRTSPLLWDSASIDGDARARQFLMHAAEYGIRSGVVIGVCNTSGCRVGLGLNSPISPVPIERHQEISRNVGTMMLLASRLADLFMAHFVNRGVPPMQQGAPLSARERQCVGLAARGMTSGDIGIKLSITCRTVNFHFGNILSKLGVLNRNEAIAKAVSQGLIQFPG